MKIPVFSLGSRGDVRPYLSLIRALRAAGHDAFLAGVDQYATYAQFAQVPFVSIGEYPFEELTQVMTDLVTEPDELKHPKIIAEKTKISTIQLGDRAIEVSRDADLIVSHNLSLMGLITSQVHGKRWATGHLFPSFIASDGMNLQGTNLGWIGNRIYWWLAGRVLSRSCDPVIDEVMDHFKLPRHKNYMNQANHSPLLNLVAISPEFLPRDRRWAPHYQMTGYWFLDEKGFEPDRRLAEFVAAGPPPVVISFGSMYGIDAAKLTEMLISAISKLGQRAILQAGWAKLGGSGLPSNILPVDFVPHDWLFPRAACVVHHGGAGTTAATVRAGVPSVVVYHLGDQHFWSRQLHRQGVAPVGQSCRKLSADWFASAIGEATSNTKMRESARSLGEKVRAEDGAREAVRLIEALRISK